MSQWSHEKMGGVDQILPSAVADVDPDDVYAAARPDLGDRAWLLANFVISADGAATSSGRSEGLSSPADKRLFGALRGVADVVLVGAGTVRAEGYGPVKVSAERRARRRRRGQPEVPALAIVTASGLLDYDAPLFTEAEVPTVIVTTPSGADAVAGRAPTIVAGDGRVEVRTALRLLHETGARVVLTEGGPALLSDALREGVLDEMCLTLAPRLAGPGQRAMTTSGEGIATRDMTLASLLIEDGFLFCRYVSDGPVTGA
jgi:riboflavin biosynthesis pyrimidine reductase